MRFTQSISSLFVSGLLATTAVAGVIKPASRGIKRRDIDEEDLREAWKNACGGSSGIFRRGDIDVNLNEAKSGGPDDRLWTGGLATCIGMTVVGTRKEGEEEAPNHFMVHIVMDEESDAWEEFKEMVEENKDKLDNLKSYITLPDLNNKESVKAMLNAQLGGSDDSDEEDLGEVTDAMVDLSIEDMREDYDQYKSDLSSLVTIAGEYAHDMGTSNTMESDGKGVVKVNGNQL